MTNKQQMKKLADELRDVFLKSGQTKYSEKYILINKKTGKTTGKYLVVAVFRVDKEIFDEQHPATKATAQPSREGSVMQSTRTCLCCKGTGIISG